MRKKRRKLMKTLVVNPIKRQKPREVQTPKYESGSSKIREVSIFEFIVYDEINKRDTEKGSKEDS